MFKAVWLTREDGVTHANYGDAEESLLGHGKVRVRVEWSSLNYKDALAITGRSPVVRSFPLIPGIDLAGCVEASDSADFAVGDRVVLNGWGHGETLPGGLSTLAVVPAEHLLRLPDSMTARAAMAVGTAGYTAMLCVLALERAGVRPGSGEILVTGAGGGVGGFAIYLLARAGFTVVAASGREGEAGRLKRLGAASVIPRSDLSQPGRPLQKERWAGVVDSVGSHTLANACAQMRYRGVVTACGLAQGMDFAGSVAPFILRGVSLIGIDSVMAPLQDRRAAWDRLASDLDVVVIEDMATEIPLADVIGRAPDLLDGRVAGRLLVKTF
jgi:acrylyl-CoA reductase (NADPH)